MTSHIKQPPKAVGLYDPRFEHDACGVGMVARLDNLPTHEVVSRAITALENLEHRGANGADPRTGDGGGILMQMPDELLRAVVDFELPPPGRYGVLMCFLPQDDGARARLEALLERTAAAEGQRLLGWREVPVCVEHTGEVAGACRPVIRQLFVGAGPGEGNERTPAGEDAFDQDAFERKLYVIRRVCELTAGEPGLYVTSSSSRTINYKGMLISFQLAAFYPDLRDERCKSALALVHSRFSTNTFPSWELAHPYRVICHNGEINTVMGNINWMRARESELRSELFGAEDLRKILPVVSPGNSDSATFDNVLELLLLDGRSLPHAAMMMIPEAYRNREDLPEALKGFYAFHSCLMEPWDGPASVAFTDGRVVGATLDRNGLRPGRWVETTDGHVVLGSLVDRGLSMLLWAGFVRIFLIHNVTWSVNSICHFFGSRRSDVDDTSTRRVMAGPVVARRGVAPQPPRLPAAGLPLPTPVRTLLLRLPGPGARARGLTWDIVRVLPERKRATLARSASTPRAREVVTCAK